MIKIFDGKKEISCSNKKGLAVLKQSNPAEQFRIAVCKDTKKEVVQVLEKDKTWLCLHD